VTPPADDVEEETESTTVMTKSSKELDDLTGLVKRIYTGAHTEAIASFHDTSADALEAYLLESSTQTALSDTASDTTSGTTKREVPHFVAAAFTEIVDEIRERDMEKARRRKTRVKRLNTKRGVHDSVGIRQALVQAGEKDDREYADRQIGVDANNFMDWNMKPIDAVGLTVGCLARMFLTVGLLFIAAWVPIMHVETAVQEVISTNSSTLFDSTTDNRTVGATLLMWSGVVQTVVYISVSVCLTMGAPKSFVMMCTPFVFVMLSVILYYEHGGDHISGKVLGFLMVVIGAGSAGIMSAFFFAESDEDNGRNIFALANKRAKSLIETGIEYKSKTRKQLVQAGLLLALPNFLIYGIQAFLVIVILWLFKAGDSVSWKVFVTLLAFVIKVAGNKLLLTLLGGLAMWLADLELYAYEFSTALLLRILQLSIPDEATAQTIGLVGAVAEVCVRIYFYNNFIKAGLKNQRMTDEQKRQYAKWGKLRVQDGNNDMVVEYMSSLVAGLFMIYLAPLGVFNFATSKRIETAIIVKLCAFQIVPEIFLDFYVTFMEINGGLSSLHTSYWSLKTGSDPNSKYAVLRVGDLPKAFAMKFLVTMSFTCFVLLVSLK
jgi:hypothetical protein